MAGTETFRANASLAQGEVSGIAAGVQSYTGPASYATGGFAIDLATDQSLGNDPFKVDVKVITTAGGAPAAGYYGEYDYTDKKIVVFVRTTGVETAGAVDLSALTLRAEWKASKA